MLCAQAWKPGSQHAGGGGGAGTRRLGVGVGYAQAALGTAGPVVLWVPGQTGQQESVLETDWGPVFGGKALGTEVGRFELFPGQALWLGMF